MVNKKRKWIISLIIAFSALYVFCATGCYEFKNDPGGRLRPGNWKLTIQFKGMERIFYLHIPASYQDTVQVPLVMNFHGFSEDVNAMSSRDGFVDKSDETGFILAYVEGYGTAGLQSWNAGTACCSPAVSSGLDDVGLSVAIVNMISSRCRIDSRRVYAHGFSNGGGMAHRLAREAANVFAAVSSVSMPVLVPDEIPSRPVSVIHFHGTSDSTINYDGGVLFGEEYISANESFTNWAGVNGCTGQPVETFKNGNARSMTYQSCEGGTQVTLCTVTGGSHVLYGNGSVDIADAAWEFMSWYTLP